MPLEPEDPVMLVGLTRVRDHCTFAWQQPERGGQISVEVVASHCDACVAEVRGRGWRVNEPEE